MSNFYIHRDLLKNALGIPTSTTGDHAQLDDTLETVSRLLDDYLGFHVFPSSGTRDYTPGETTRLQLDAPLLGVDSIQTTSDGVTYGTTLSTTGYNLMPYNATQESPPRPWWCIEITDNASAVFPRNIKRGARIAGTWGYYNVLKSSTATLATDITSAVTAVQINGATSLHAGQTLLVGTEQMFVTATPVSSSGSHSSGITVERAKNGTLGATHSSGNAIQVYDYPIVGRATLYQAEMDYRAKDAPLGYIGGGDVVQRPQGIGLHPFVRRMLDGLRKPVAE